jgi:hypothetical protein
MRKKLKIVFSLLVILMFITTALPCYAAKNKAGGQAPAEIGDIIYGCYKKVNGQLRIVSGPENCNPSELPISWSNTEGAGGGDLSNTYIVTCQNTQNCYCDTTTTAGMVLSGYAECPAGAVLASAGTPVDETNQGFQANCMNLDGTYVNPAYIAIRCIGISVEANCSDTVDNDGDGMVDCADTDCASDPACAAPVENCTDGSDNDGDGAIDCADTDCASDPACAAPVENCTDGSDNDGDGAIDCADTDCASDPACAAPVENCTDGSDNDGDGAIDCADTDCASDPACQVLTVPVENCSDGIDNDGDGKTDCKDKDCKKTAACK